MSASHYLVSGIQVAGLIVGLYGFFFLSIGIFGTKSVPWFRALLPATAAWLGVALVFFALSSAGIQTLMPSWVLLIVFLLSGAEAYFLAVRGVPDSKVFHYFVPAVAVLAIISPAYLAGLVFFQHLTGAPSHNPYVVVLTVVDIGISLYVWAFIAVLWLPRILNQDRLLKLGFFLSAVAILSQFIPPVLDLFNITITN